MRNEELLKNAVHYLLTNMQLGSPLDELSASNELSQQYAIKRIDDGPLLLREAFIEAVTLILHTIFKATELRGSTFEGRLTNLWSLEKSFAYYQSAKMIHQSTCETYYQFINPTDNRIEQTVPAAEAHLLKTALIFTPEKLLALVRNPKNLQKKLLSLIHENTTNQTFIREIDRFVDWLAKGNNLAPLFSTGRLTVVE